MRTDSGRRGCTTGSRKPARDRGRQRDPRRLPRLLRSRDPMNHGRPVERPLELVARDRGGVYLDERLAGLELPGRRSVVSEPIDARRVEPDRLHRARNRHHRTGCGDRRRPFIFGSKVRLAWLSSSSEACRRRPDAGPSARHAPACEGSSFNLPSNRSVRGREGLRRVALKGWLSGSTAEGGDRDTAIRAAAGSRAA
jgi:hypothetical protein